VCIPQRHQKWDNFSERKQFLDGIAKKLKMKDLSEWYSVKKTDKIWRGGYKMLHQHYNDSPSKALKYIYPEYPWVPWHFTKVPRNFWNSSKNRREYFDWLRGQLGFKKMEDWYFLTVEHFKLNGGNGILHYFGGSIFKSLQSVFPGIVQDF
jgi:hypothetical protein